jgi:hypothetical protein
MDITEELTDASPAPKPKFATVINFLFYGEFPAFLAELLIQNRH